MQSVEYCNYKIGYKIFKELCKNISVFFSIFVQVQMKKFIITILAVFYLGISSGATMHFHYCMGQLIESGLISKEFKKCSKCGMKADSTKNCCKHDSKLVKVDNAQKLSDNSYHFKAFSSDLAWNKYSVVPEVYASSITEEQPLSNAPPATDNTPVFIRNCTFRI